MRIHLDGQSIRKTLKPFLEDEVIVLPSREKMPLKKVKLKDLVTGVLTMCHGEWMLLLP